MSSLPNFYAFEGIDGAGKTTTIERVRRHYESLGRRVTVVGKHEQLELLEGPANELYRTLTENRLGGRTPREVLEFASRRYWLLYLALWHEFVSCYVCEASRSGAQMILADSWIYRPIARFSYAGDEDARFIQRCFDVAALPDRIFFLVAPVDVVYERRKAHPAKDFGVFDGLEGQSRKNYVAFQSAIQDELRALIPKDRLVEVAADDGEAEVADAVIAVMDGSSRWR